MYSRARIAGHPIHPMLVALPIGMYVATTAALIAHVATGDAFYYRAAMVASIAGVACALVAAIPGAIDLASLPRGSRARLVAIKHGSVALFATGLYAVCAALLSRGWLAAGEPLDARLPLGLALAGIAALVVVGALGWTLVQTHHVGVAATIVRPPAPDADELPDVVSPMLRTPNGRSRLQPYRH